MNIGEYKVIGKIGHGGMASAFLGEAPDGTRVVLKVPGSRDEELCRRLQDEAAVGVRLLHPTLVETVDLIEHKGLPVLVVGYIDGKPVESVRKGGPISVEAVLRIGEQLAAGLHVLHTARDHNDELLNIVHRDISGNNVLIDKTGNAKIIDLGIARSRDVHASTDPDTLRGTFRYFAPELFMDDPPSPRSDVWSLGAVLLELGTGEPIFEGAPPQIMYAIHNSDPVTVARENKMGQALTELLRFILARDPRHRPLANEVEEKIKEMRKQLAGDGQAELRVRVAQAETEAQLDGGAGLDELIDSRPERVRKDARKAMVDLFGEASTPPPGDVMNPPPIDLSPTPAKDLYAQYKASRPIQMERKFSYNDPKKKYGGVPAADQSNSSTYVVVGVIALVVLIIGLFMAFKRAHRKPHRSAIDSVPTLIAEAPEVETSAPVSLLFPL